MLLPPVSSSFTTLLSGNREELATEQVEDPNIQEIREHQRTSTPGKKNISFQVRSSVLYRLYKDKCGVERDQLVVPQKYRADLLRLPHGSLWLCQLGTGKTKQILLQEYYWPGCFKGVDKFVRSCDTCQRVRKAQDKWKAPMVLVAIITKLLQRLVIDVVGPLPVTETGYRYIPTILCPATKFPEVPALREATECCEFATVYRFLSWIPFQDPN